MNQKIGQVIKKIATSKGLSQKQFGEKINRTKQAVANIYKRETIDVELLKDISAQLDHDFFAYYYEHEPMRKFKEEEREIWDSQVEKLKTEISYKDDLLKKNDEILVLQRKYIAELEEKLKK